MVILTLGLCLAGLSIYAAHPIFATGVWSDSEPIGIAIQAAAALIYLGLALACASSPAAARMIAHPAVLTPVALGAWSALAALFTPFPWLSILGPPQSGQGALLPFIFAGAVAAVMVIRRNRLLLGLVIMSVSLGAIGQWIPVSPTTHLLGFSEYQAYYTLGLLPVGWVMIRQMRTRLFGAAVLLLSVLVLVLSKNRAATYAIVAIVAAGIALAQPAAARLALWLGAWAQRSRLAVVGAVFGGGLAPYLFLRLSNLQDVDGSLWSRKILFKALEPSLTHPATALLTGHGWGRFADYLATNLPLTGVSLYQSQWGGLGRDLFHSHNAWLEGLFAAGLPGLGLAVAIPASAVLFSQPRYRVVSLAFALCWTIVDGFWFMMPVSLAALALAVGVMAETTAAPRRPRNRAGLCTVLLGFTLVFVGVSATLADYGRGMDRLRDCLSPGSFAGDCAELAVPKDPRGNELPLAILIDSDATNLAATDPAASLARASFVRRVLDTARARSATGASPVLALAIANIDASTAFAGSPPKGQDSETLARIWPRDLDVVLQQAPTRIDIMGPYFNWLVLTNRVAAMKAALATAQRIAPDHPVTQWFAGELDLAAPDHEVRARGVAEMRAALRAGVKRYIAVDPSVEAALSPSTGE